MTIRILLILAILTAGLDTRAQFSGNPLIDQIYGNNSMSADTPGIQKQIQGNMPAIGNQAPKSLLPDSLAKKVEVSSAEAKLLELRNFRLRMEDEIAQMKAKGVLSPEEKEILSLKSENLKIIIEKERILLQEELDKVAKEKEQKIYPPAVIYGQQFFRDNNIKSYQKSDEIIPGDNYILGPGDVVQLEVWGYTNYSQTMTVNEQGYIEIPRLLKLFVKGMSLQKVRSLVASRLGTITDLNNSTFNLTVSRSRVISINIVGEVFRPGTYTLPAINNAFNALASMGGPSNIGSVRNIYVKREGKIIDSLDVYDYVSDPGKSREVFLQNNDYLMVSPASKVVTISGAVNRPGTYELKKNEKLSKLLRFAAGTQANTYLKDVLITRIVDHSRYERISVNYDSLQKAGKDFELVHGDNIQFKSIADDNNFLVEISGAVNIPGLYKIRKGARITDVIRLSNGLLNDVYTEKAYLIRTNPDLSLTYYSFSPKEIMNNPFSVSNMEVDKQDRITIYRKQDFFDRYIVTVSGAVRKPDTLNYIQGLKLSQLLFMSGGLKEDADPERGYIIRTLPNLEKRYIPFSPSGVMKDSLSSENITLEARDAVKVYSLKEFAKEYNVAIEGAVRNPGQFTYAEEARLLDLIDMAGGLNEFAFKERAILFRREPGELKARNISIDLTDVIKNPDSKNNLLLTRNDRLKIFSVTEFTDDYNIEIYGEVRKQGVIPYTEALTLKDVLYLAGGFKLSAVRSKLEVVRTIGDINNQKEPVKATVLSVEVGSNLLVDQLSENFLLQPYDMIFVRKNPLFNDVKTVTIHGAVQYPGRYALTGDNEKLSSLMKRAGGFKPDANISGTTMVRRKPDSASYATVAMNLRKALHHKRSYYNYILKNGDSIIVPISSSLVTITGAVNLHDKKEIMAFYRPGKRAKFYIRNFAGGFAVNAHKKLTTVEYSDGRTKKVRSYVFFRRYPKLAVGATVRVAKKPELGDKGKRSKVNLDEFLSKTTARITAIITLISLYRIATN